MKDDTLVVVCGYSGDEEQIHTLRPAYEHHNAPILILSPEDAPIERFGPHKCLTAGKRCYIGQDSLDRQHLHMSLALEQPFAWYLFHDADSCCVSASIPAYLYENDRVVWSNQVVDPRELGYHDPLPHIAMQPPYFMSREVLRQYVIHGRQTACSVTPFIDWYMVQVAVAGGIIHEGFPDGSTYPTKNNAEGMEKTLSRIREGATMIHSIKTQDVFETIMEERKRYLKTTLGQVF